MGRRRPIYQKWVELFILGLVICYFGVQALQGALSRPYLPECPDTQNMSQACLHDVNTLQRPRNIAIGILTIGVIVTGVSGRGFYKAFRNYRKAQGFPMNYDDYTS